MIQSILRSIEAGNSFLITTHENPDGDAAGSSLALAGFLQELGKQVTVYFCDPVPENYLFLPGAEQVVHTLPDAPFDVCFVLDVGELKRAGKEVGAFRRFGSIINIDHHLTGDTFGDINYVDAGASATGALIYRLIRESGRAVSYPVALCIYTAVITDTGSFRYSNADPEAFAIAGAMVAAGVDAWSVSEKLYESQPAARLQLLALALGTLDISPRGDFASLTVSLDMFGRTGTGPEHTDGFVNYPRSIRGVEVAVFFRELRPRHFKVGFRSKGRVNVAALTAEFGGGGHHNAAGCTVSGDIETVKSLIFSHLEKALA